MKIDQDSNAKVDEKNENAGVPDYYKATLEFEDRESRLHSEEEDQQTFMSISKDIKQLMKEIHRLKAEKPDKYAVEVEDKRVKVLMLMMSLKKLSRIQKLRVKNVREVTTESRQGIDTVTLQLQNLLYEISHLQKDVKRCLDFQSADQEIDLVPIDQFYQEAPESISRPAETNEDKHEQRLAQLHWELEQRRGQTELFDKLTQEKERIANIISDQETKLGSLLPKVNSILEATIPLQADLDLPLDAQREQQQISMYLPPPLYTLYVQCSAYKEACDSLMNVVIKGDFEAAKKQFNEEEDDKTDGSDSEPENDGQEEGHSQESRSRKKSMEKEEKTDDLKEMLSSHPLYVVVTISTKKKDSVVVEFGYAKNLRIVTTKCSVNVVSLSKPILVDVLSKDTFLVSLFPGDMGTSSPNPANIYQLRPFKNRLQPNFLDTLGAPYKWAQTLAGVSFLPDQAHDGDDVKMKKVYDCLSWQTSAEHMKTIIKAIRRRLKARLVLQEQLIALETCTTLSDISISADILKQYFPAKISSDIQSWRPILWEDYIESNSTQDLLKNDLVDSSSLTFKAVLERGAVSLVALVAVSLDYPNTVPIFAVSIDWKGPEKTLVNTYLKDLETEVNLYWEELVPNCENRLRILSLQLYRLAMCFDVLTESICAQVQDQSTETMFHKEKIFFRSARGRDRALPFMYMPKLGVFCQR